MTCQGRALSQTRVAVVHDKSVIRDKKKNGFPPLLLHVKRQEPNALNLERKYQTGRKSGLLPYPWVQNYVTNTGMQRIEQGGGANVFSLFAIHPVGDRQAWISGALGGWGI